MVSSKKEAQRRPPSTRRAVIVAQDPSIRRGDAVLTVEIDIPAEKIAAGPAGARVRVVDYDASTNLLFTRASIPEPADTSVLVLPDAPADLLSDPHAHATNVYAIVMRILSRFEFALGRRVAWGFPGHQLHVVPHAFAEANAFYSRADRSLFFGYFADNNGQPIYSCLAHDVVAHETTHALLDGLRARYLEPSSPDQAAFHEGFADIVAILSVFSLKDLVGHLLAGNDTPSPLISRKRLTRKALEDSVLFGLAKEMGQELQQVRGLALRRSVTLPRNKDYLTNPAFDEEHRRGEILVAAFLDAFLTIWIARIDRLGTISEGHLDRGLVVEEGARVADHLLTMAIRALDYAPPTDITFGDYLAALITVDREVVADDSRYGYRKALIKSFADYGIKPPRTTDRDGAWRLCELNLSYGRTRFDSLVRDPEEIFRFLWENREALQLDDAGYIEVQSVRACNRIGPDGFILHETVAEYVQILTIKAEELLEVIQHEPPRGISAWQEVRMFGGGTLIFDEYGRLKFHIGNGIAQTRADRQRQKDRLDYLARYGRLDTLDNTTRLGRLHLNRALSVEEEPL